MPFRDIENEHFFSFASFFVGFPLCSNQFAQRESDKGNVLETVLSQIEVRLNCAELE